MNVETTVVSRIDERFGDIEQDLEHRDSATEFEKEEHQLHELRDSTEKNLAYPWSAEIIIASPVDKQCFVKLSIYHVLIFYRLSPIVASTCLPFFTWWVSCPPCTLPSQNFTLDHPLRLKVAPWVLYHIRFYYTIAPAMLFLYIVIGA